MKVQCGVCGAAGELVTAPADSEYVVGEPVGWAIVHVLPQGGRATSRRVCGSCYPRLRDLLGI